MDTNTNPTQYATIIVSYSDAQEILRALAASTLGSAEAVYEHVFADTDESGFDLVEIVDLDIDEAKTINRAMRYVHSDLEVCLRVQGAMMEAFAGVAS